jgi:zinc-ribbon domain
MAFCNSCGAALDAGTRFCSKCGAAVSAAAPAAASPAPGAPAPPAQGSSALKIILIIVGVIVLLGILAIGSLTVFGLWIAKKSHVQQKNGNVKIESPFGNMETTTDPDEAAKNLGVALYPGAEMRKGGSADVTFGKMHTSKVILETDDSPDQVADFYRTQFPNASLFNHQGDRYSIMQGGPGDMTTVAIYPEDGKTRIDVSRVITAH